MLKTNFKFLNITLPIICILIALGILSFIDYRNKMLEILCYQDSIQHLNDYNNYDDKIWQDIVGYSYDPKYIGKSNFKNNHCYYLRWSSSNDETLGLGYSLHLTIYDVYDMKQLTHLNIRYPDRKFNEQQSKMIYGEPRYIRMDYEKFHNIYKQTFNEDFNIYNIREDLSYS